MKTKSKSFYLLLLMILTNRKLRSGLVVDSFSLSQMFDKISLESEGITKITEFQHKCQINSLLNFIKEYVVY